MPQLYRVQIRRADHSLHWHSKALSLQEARAKLPECLDAVCKKGYVIEKAYPSAYALRGQKTRVQLFIEVIRI